MKAVIICDGRPPTKQQIEEELRDATLFIAADGGAAIAHQFGLIPDTIIGDMDSYEPLNKEREKTIIDPDQETNDLEKALHYAKNKTVKFIVVFGATGKRMDHSLKNLSVLKQFNSQFAEIIFKDTYSDIQLIHSPFKTEVEPGTSISLFPLSGKVDGITTKGLKYPLQNGVLQNGVHDGSSNEAVEEIVEIEFKKGDLLYFKNHK